MWLYTLYYFLVEPFDVLGIIDYFELYDPEAADYWDFVESD